MNSLVIFMANYVIFIVALIAVTVTLFSEKRVRNRIIILALLSFLIAFGIALMAENIYYDPRPFVLEHITPLIPHSPDNGFPSDHTLYAMVTSITVFIFKRKAGILLGILSVLIGVARVIAGIHHPVDVIGSVAIGIIATFLGWLVMKVLTRIRVLSGLFGQS